MIESAAFELCREKGVREEVGGGSRGWRGGEKRGGKGGAMGNGGATGKGEVEGRGQRGGKGKGGGGGGLVFGHEEAPNDRPAPARPAGGGQVGVCAGGGAGDGGDGGGGGGHAGRDRGGCGGAEDGDVAAGAVCGSGAWRRVKARQPTAASRGQRAGDLGRREAGREGGREGDGVLDVAGWAGEGMASDTGQLD